MKPNDLKWPKAVKAMMKVLESKLSSDELYQLFDMIDSDPPGGPFYAALGDKVVALFPEKFADPEDDEPIEMDPPGGEQDFPTIEE